MPRLLCLLALVIGLTAGCATAGGAAGARAASDQAAAETSDGGDGRLRGEVTVLAAASLTDAFERIATAFEAEHPATAVRLSFAGSQRLAMQIVQGAPADVFAAADDSQMDVVGAAGRLARAPRQFAGNHLAIAVEPGNPREIDGLEDLAGVGLKVVLAAEDVPAGRYTRQALDAADIDITPVSLETDVRAVLTKVALGEADAGIVYASDIVAASDDVQWVRIPSAHNVTARYSIVVVADAPNPAAARAFVDYVISPPGQAILARFGFAAP